MSGWPRASSPPRRRGHHGGTARPSRPTPNAAPSSPPPARAIGSRQRCSANRSLPTRRPHRRPRATGSRPPCARPNRLANPAQHRRHGHRRPGHRRRAMRHRIAARPRHRSRPASAHRQLNSRGGARGRDVPAARAVVGPVGARWSCRRPGPSTRRVVGAAAPSSTSPIRPTPWRSWPTTSPRGDGASRNGASRSPVLVGGVHLLRRTPQHERGCRHRTR